VIVSAVWLLLVAVGGDGLGWECSLPQIKFHSLASRLLPQTGCGCGVSTVVLPL